MLRRAGVNSDRAPSAPLSGASWFVSGLGIGQICSWGALYYSFPLIAEAMGAELGWSKAALYGAATLGLIIAAGLAYPIGKAIDRGHGRLVMSGGSLAAGLLLLIWSQLDALWLFFLVVGALGGLQAAVLYEPAFAVIARRASAAGARRAITALTLWGGFASTVFIPLTQILIEAFDWRGALIGLGLINLACAWLYHQVIGPLPDRAAPAPAEPARIAHDPLRLAVRSPVFWALAVAFTAHAGAFAAFSFHLYALLLERGFAAADIVLAMAVIGPAQVAGRIAMMAFAPRASVRRVGSVVVVGFPLAFALLALVPPNIAAMFGIAALYGAANGVLTIVRGLAVPEMITSTGYGAINGAMNAPATIAKALAPLGAALLWQAGDSYALPILAMIAGALVLTAGFWCAAWFSTRRPVLVHAG